MHDKTDMISSLLPENALILHGAKTHLSAAEVEAVNQLMNGKLDWDYIADKAYRHGLAPLLYDHLKARDWLSDIPLESRIKLEDSYYSSLVRYMHLSQEVGRVLEAFSESGIMVILLKGMALAEFIYPSPALRPMDDVDLLVRQYDLYKAKQLLEKLGYAPKGVGRGWPGFENYHHLPPYCHEQKHVIIEVHCLLHVPSIDTKIDINKLWMRSHKFHAQTSGALVLAPEDWLVHLCLHIALQDRFSVRWLKLTDVAELASYFEDKYELWELAYRRARDWGVVEPVFWVLYLVQTLLNMRLPVGVLDKFRQKLLDEEFTDQLVGYVINNDSNRMSNRAVGFITTTGLRSKLEILGKVIIPSITEMTQQYRLCYPGKNVYIYYLIRPIDLILRYSRLLGRYVMKRPQDVLMIERRRVINDWAKLWYLNK